MPHSAALAAAYSRLSGAGGRAGDWGGRGRGGGGAGAHWQGKVVPTPLPPRPVPPNEFCSYWNRTLPETSRWSSWVGSLSGEGKNPPVNFPQNGEGPPSPQPLKEEALALKETLAPQTARKPHTDTWSKWTHAIPASEPNSILTQV